MYAKLTFAFIALSLALLAFIHSGDAECCGREYYFISDRGIRVACADCASPKYFYCSKGSGGCNVFGCNCDGGCLQPIKGLMCSYDCCVPNYGRKERDVGNFMPVPLTGNFTGNEVMNHIDTNKDGRLDEVEITIFVTRHGLPAAAWRHLDVDGDSHLTAHEIDNDLLPLATDMV